MRWNRVENAEDVIDARGAGGSGGGRMSGLPGGMALPTGGVGLVAVLVLLGIQLLGGGTSFDVPTALDDQAAQVEPDPLPATNDPDAKLKDFTVAVFTDVQSMWREVFTGSSLGYDRAKLVLYRRGVNSGCGAASSAVGPFYCPADKRVYLDLSFQSDMRSQLGADGDFAWAYVIAHEMGHHAQQELGTDDRVRDLARQSPDQANALSVRQELQADCYAGVWAQRAYRAGALEEGDIDEALNAAAAVGDDRQQSRGGGGVNPDSFTHGTSEQRSRWFKKGYESGDADACDTFAAEDL